MFRLPPGSKDFLFRPRGSARRANRLVSPRGPEETRAVLWPSGPLGEACSSCRNAQPIGENGIRRTLAGDSLVTRYAWMLTREHEEPGAPSVPFPEAGG